MEEILASIRRIISEDTPPTPAASDEIASEPEASMDDVLELTEVVEDDEPPPAPQPPPPPIRVAPPEPMPEPAPIHAESFADPAHDRLVSNSTATVSAAALASLGDRVRRRTAPDIPLGHAGVTLEEIVKDLLRPMLRDWLDSNLPGIVERLVEEEVRRLSREASGSGF
jgi:cell pole-organizing protein PopZ